MADMTNVWVYNENQYFYTRHLVLNGKTICGRQVEAFKSDNLKTVEPETRHTCFQIFTCQKCSKKA